ncbi:amphi-Trp domain-containing protein [Kitasatospora sp. NPDC101801]|uniref:amphi-Trp domain-containing protein n=1 Tax=Kitasatospora sp. NPDC101801 TaxID=3364103 RepID=UPI0038167E5C
MKDLKFEQEGTLSRLEVADRLAALAEALRSGGTAELDLGSGKLTLRVPDELTSEFEVEVGDGHIELEIELKWPTTRTTRTTPSTRTAPTPPPAPAAAAPRRPAAATKKTAARGRKS